LPVAVSIAMALSVNNLKKDNILIKNLDQYKHVQHFMISVLEKLELLQLET